MEFKNQKRLVSRILNVGLKRIWFDPLRLEDIKQAITRSDIHDLVKERAIRIKAEKRKKADNTKRKRRNSGSVRVKVANRKSRYVNRIRKIREELGMRTDKIFR